MPPAKKVKQMEALRLKGLDVDYPRAPWFTDNVEKIKKEDEARMERIKSGQNSEFLERLPASRDPTPDRVRHEKPVLFSKFSVPK